MMPKQSLIKTARLSLRAITENDRDDLIRIFKDERVNMTYMIPVLDTKEKEDKLFQKIMRQSHTDKYIYGVYLNDRFIGLINEVESNDDTIELGYLIDPLHQKQGYMTEVLSKVIDDLFTLGYKKVITGAFKENIASIKVMCNCGMQKIDRYDEIDYKGRRHHCVYYAKQKEDQSRIL